MSTCKVKMPPERKEVLGRPGDQFAGAYWLNVDCKPLWLASVAMGCEFDQQNTLLGEPLAWFYLPPVNSQPIENSHIY